MLYSEYKAEQTRCRNRFHFRISEAEREQLNKVMEAENIPDASKAIRFLIAKEADTIAHSTTFKQFIQDNYSQYADDTDTGNCFGMVIYDILHDETFPENEQDGMMVRGYIHQRQDPYMAGNDEMLAEFDHLWNCYKYDIKPKA